MTVATLEIRTCDRCGKRAELHSEAQRGPWGEFGAETIDRKEKVAISGPEVPVSKTHCIVHTRNTVDLCPDCFKQLMKWWVRK